MLYEVITPVFALTLDEIGRNKLAGSNRIQALIKVTDTRKDSYETATDPHPVKVARKEVIHELVGPPRGSVAIQPARLTIEEVTTIDSSPLLNYVFFETVITSYSIHYTKLYDSTAVNCRWWSPLQ